MSTNTESTSNSIRFAPMPMSALLANLMPLQSQPDSSDASYTSIEDSDDSFPQTVAKKASTPLKIRKDFSTPSLKVSHPKNIKAFASERKTVHSEHNKENASDIWNSNRTHPNNKDVLASKTQRTNKTPVSNSKQSVDVNQRVVKRSLLIPPNSITKTSISSIYKRTPEHKPLSSAHKLKSVTPKIKSGIRKFTPGSERRSHKKPLSNVIQNRDKVRVELFSQKDEPQIRPDPPSTTAPVPDTPLNRKPTASMCVATPSHPQGGTQPEAAPVLDTPSNKKPMPPPCAATPSYPHGVLGGNSKVQFKTTSIKDKKYMFMKKLGAGGSSEVYKVLELGTFNEYAVKCVQLGTDKELAKSYINEVQRLIDLQGSDRVVKLIDYEYDRVNQSLRLVLEVGETDLSSLLKARGGALTPTLVLHYWSEMLQAVNYIHKRGVIHADLKPANFLLVSGQLKLIDFGIASAISSDATSVIRSQAAGTYSYISPEALMGGAGGYGNSHTAQPIKISFRSDVWSLGCILYSMVYGRTPFSHIPNLAKLAAILDPNHRIDYPPADHVPAALISALRWCLTYNARKRPTVQELMDIQYFQPNPAIPVSTELPAPLHDKLKQLLSPEEYALVRPMPAELRNKLKALLTTEEYALVVGNRLCS